MSHIAFNSLSPYELGETGSAEAIPYLIKYLDKGGINEKRLAASGINKLSKIHTTEVLAAIPVLLRILNSRAPQVRQYSLIALYKINLKGTSSSIIEKIAKGDEKEYNRTIAQKVLKKHFPQRSKIVTFDDVDELKYKIVKKKKNIRVSKNTDVFQKNCIACNKEFDHPIISNVGILCKTCRAQGLFRKKLIITGITRMGYGNICVSGIDPETLRFVRPVYSSKALHRDFTMEGSTQVIKHFNLVEMEFKEYRPSQVHHTEDWLVNENFAPKFERHLKDEEVIRILKKVSINNLQEAIDAQDKSLFIVKAQKITKLYDEIHFGKFKVRISFIDQTGNKFEHVPVTDLLILAKVRYMLESGINNYAKKMIKRFNNNPFNYIRIGITRKFAGAYWKQVTAMITIPDMFDGDSFSKYEKKLGSKV